MISPSTPFRHCSARSREPGTSSVPTEPAAAITLAGKVLSRIGLIRQIAALPQYAFFVPMMGPTERRFRPLTYLFEVRPILL